MRASLVIGSQWGDEGKGKISDFLSTKAAYVVRFNGGNNAGHTVINNYGKFPLHLVPSGIFSDATACITNGTVLDLEVLAEEIQMLEKAGITLKGRLLISPRCHVIMPYHKMLDALYEQAKGKGKTGTTGRGIGPVFADKVSYNGIRQLFFLRIVRIFSREHIKKIKKSCLTAIKNGDIPWRKLPMIVPSEKINDSFDKRIISLRSGIVT